MRLRITIGLTLALLASAALAETTYVVKQGDRLSDICRAHNVELDVVVRLNRIANPDLIFPGQEIKLPVGAEEAAALGEQTRAAPESRRLSTSATLPFKQFGGVASNMRAVSRVKIAEAVLEKLEQAPPTAAGGFHMAVQLSEIMLRAPNEDRALVGGMLALIMTPYSATLASTLGTAPTFAMDAVFPAAKLAIGEVIQRTLVGYGRVGASNEDLIDAFMR